MLIIQTYSVINSLLIPDTAYNSIAVCYHNISKPKKINGRIFASKKLKKYFCLRIWRVLTLSIPTYESLNIAVLRLSFYPTFNYTLLELMKKK